MIDYNAKYNRYLNLFNEEMNDAFDKLSISSVPQVLKEAMVYAVADGGKRIRPVLCLAAAEMLGVPFEQIKKFAFAIELVHSYSLVHDDLPAMDNDDYRRGKFSTHKQFGEANGILAGDALLNFAFEYCLSNSEFGKKDAVALRALASAAGCFGMIAGQVLDLQNEKNPKPDEKILYEIYSKKTAKLLTVPLLIPSIFAENKYYSELESFGYNLGIMFQISDDLMDVEGAIASIGKTPHKDEESDKLTSIKIFGVDGAKKRIKLHYDKCIEAISSVNGNDFLIELAYRMYVRKK